MEMKVQDVLSLMKEEHSTEHFQSLRWTGTFREYVSMVLDNPSLIRNAYQRLYDMIISYGVEEYTSNKEKLIRYNFFSDPTNNGADAIFGLQKPLAQLVSCFKSAAAGFGTERRVLLLHGPVGSAKSTIARLLKKGLEAYSRTDEGTMYNLQWKLVENGEEVWTDCPMNSDPMLIFPVDVRKKILASLNKDSKKPYRYSVEGDLCPASRLYYKMALESHGGDWDKMIEEDIRVSRLVLSEKDRIGIGTFQPKDEKNQDSTELTGDINYRKIAEYGCDSDPRAFSFDGEFNIANRGIIEFVEVLKLDVAFLYDLLGASQEHVIKPKKFAQTSIDEVIIAHTNEPEYKKLQNNPMMEAFRDRTIKIDIPYNRVLDDEVKIYERGFTMDCTGGKHLAPHTIEMASMWAILTRLEEPKHSRVTILQKLKLYNGNSISGFSEENIKELYDESPNEGMHGISPRYIQDKISSALVSNVDYKCVNPFQVINELEAGLRHHSLISNETDRKRFRELLVTIKGEYEDIVKNEVQRAISADAKAIGRLCGNYIDNVKAFTQKEKVQNKYTNQLEEPDERLMRSIEEKIDISESRKDDFRREIMNFIGALAVEGKKFDYKTNERLNRALELKLFDDQKDSIKLTSVVASVVDKETQEKIDVVKQRLVANFGYCDVCATDVLNFVASIYARGDTRDIS